MELGAAAYAGAFVASLALVLLLTPVALKIALRRSVLDHPGGYKEHESPVPYLGGVSIVAAFSGAVIIASLLGPPRPGAREAILIITLGLVLSLMGLIDDLRSLNPLLRLAIEIGVALVLWRVGIGVSIFGIEGADALITVLWIVGITNAFNLLDNMDGLSAGVAAIAAAWFFVIAATNGQIAVAALSIALCGCALGFLRHNFHPAKIYMGDAGSLFLGFLLSVIGIKLRFEGPIQVTFFVPILVLGVAIFDTVLVTATRLLHRQNPWSGGRDHTSHRLVFVGVPIRAAVSLVYGAGVALGWLALVMSRLDYPTGMILMGLVLTVSAFLSVLLGVVPVYESSKRRHMMITQIRGHEEPGPPADHPTEHLSAGA
jgi:UDP-GlcNAc:undecaprenyl-phosphate GlcNAc-1-phosphate transferase